MSREDMRRALADLRVALDDADAVVQDMLRPPRRRELGPVLHATNYHDAHARILTAHAYLTMLVRDDGGEHQDPSGNVGSSAD